MKEEFLHYIWQNNLFLEGSLKDEDDNIISVVHNGIHNFDAGPDFFNAKIKIKDTIWVGNIEIHLKSSDWKKHKHNKDKAYDNVILHLVFENDEEVFNTKNKKILTCKLSFNNKYLSSYEQLIKSKKSIACLTDIKSINSFTLNSWLSVVLVERIEQKTSYIKNTLSVTNNNWEETFYISLAKAFGFKVNSLPFELLAKSLPSIILAKHKNNLFQIEALLFGQAGLLGKSLPNDIYYSSLKKEYIFLKAKYKLKAIEVFLWKFLRIRPANFPTIRISQFANLIFNSSHLFSKIINIKELKDLSQVFEIEASEYWKTHYTFGKISDKKNKKFGKFATKNIIINTIVPLMFLYGKEKENEKIQESAISFLENLKAEKNNITKKWVEVGFEIKNAYFSQSLIQLHNEYCLKKRCLECRIGNNIIKE